MTSIAVLATFESVEAANAFIESPGFAEAMKEGGVIGAPNITISEIV